MQNFENGQEVEVQRGGSDEWTRGLYVGRHPDISDHDWHVVSAGNVSCTTLADSDIRPVRRSVEEIAAEAANRSGCAACDAIKRGIHAFAKEHGMELD